MLGHDVLYLPNLSDKALVAEAVNSNRVLLTSDLNLYRMATSHGAEAFLVKGRSLEEKLANLSNRFQLALVIRSEDSRCPKCGSSLIPVTKDVVKDKVPPTSLEIYLEFWICSNPGCGSVYWRGSHWKKINETLSQARRIVMGKVKISDPKLR
jgi:uncharacterized protein with PIN domain